MDKLGGIISYWSEKVEELKDWANRVNSDADDCVAKTISQEGFMPQTYSSVVGICLAKAIFSDESQSNLIIANKFGDPKHYLASK